MVIVVLKQGHQEFGVTIFRNYFEFDFEERSDDYLKIIHSNDCMADFMF